MSKLYCVCGHVIVDQRNNLPYKAKFLPDENEEAFWSAIINIIKSFNDAKDKGEKENWLTPFFYPESGRFTRPGNALGFDP